MIKKRVSIFVKVSQILCLSIISIILIGCSGSKNIFFDKSKAQKIKKVHVKWEKTGSIKFKARVTYNVYGSAPKNLPARTVQKLMDLYDDLDRILKEALPNALANNMRSRGITIVDEKAKGNFTLAVTPIELSDKYLTVRVQLMLEKDRMVWMNEVKGQLVDNLLIIGLPVPKSDKRTVNLFVEEIIKALEKDNFI
jgi:hypothetical protein